MKAQDLERYQRFVLGALLLLVLAASAKFLASSQDQGDLVLAPPLEVSSKSPADLELETWLRSHTEIQDQLFHLWEGTASGPLGFEGKNLRDRSQDPEFQSRARALLAKSEPFLNSIPQESLGKPGGDLVFSQKVDQTGLRRSLQAVQAGLWLHMLFRTQNQGPVLLSRMAGLLEAISRGDQGEFSLTTHILAVSHRMSLSKSFALGRLAGWISPQDPGFSAWVRAGKDLLAEPWISRQKAWSQESERVRARIEASAKQVGLFDSRKKAELAACRQALKDLGPQIEATFQGRSVAMLKYPEGSEALQTELRNVLRSLAVMREFPQRIQSHLKTFETGEPPMFGQPY